MIETVLNDPRLRETLLRYMQDYGIEYDDQKHALLAQNQQGFLVYFDARGSEIFGYHRDDFRVRMESRKLVPDDEVDPRAQIFDTIINEGGSHFQENTRRRRKDGSIVLVNAHIFGYQHEDYQTDMSKYPIAAVIEEVGQ